MKNLNLANLERNFKDRFAELALRQHEWMRSPFAAAVRETPFCESVGISCGTYL